jgi:hypothetical protein
MHFQYSRPLSPPFFTSFDLDPDLEAKLEYVETISAGNTALCMTIPVIQC